MSAFSDFLSTRQGNLPKETVSELCDGIRAELERRDLKRYISTILTAHVVKRPPDHEAALSLLLRLKGMSIASKAPSRSDTFSQKASQSS